jgi:hypothetical protein
MKQPGHTYGGFISAISERGMTSTNGWGCISLLFLAFLMSTDGVIRNNGIAHKFQERIISVECKALLKLGG